MIVLVPMGARPNKPPIDILGIVNKNEPTKMNGLYNKYVKRVVRECMGKKKTKGQWLIKGLRNFKKKDQEKK